KIAGEVVIGVDHQKRSKVTARLVGLVHRRRDDALKLENLERLGAVVARLLPRRVERLRRLGELELVEQRPGPGQLRVGNSGGRYQYCQPGVHGPDATTFGSTFDSPLNPKHSVGFVGESSAM